MPVTLTFTVENGQRRHEALSVSTSASNPMVAGAHRGSGSQVLASPRIGSVLGVRLLVIFLASKTSAGPHRDFAVACAQRGEPATPPAAG
jgi:hypothetical protein